MRAGTCALAGLLKVVETKAATRTRPTAARAVTPVMRENLPERGIGNKES
jgi:hypothetical protein